MIYEKKLCRTNIKRDDMPLKEKNVLSYNEASVTSGTMPYDTWTDEEKKTNDAPRTKRKRGVHTGKGLLLTAAALFCVVTVDTRLLGGKLSQAFMDSVHDGVKYIVENSAVGEVHEKNTLYTRLLCDVSESVAMNESEHVPEESADNQEITAPASSSVSQSFVDGTRFYPIISLDLSADNLFSLSNGTSFSPDMQSLSLIKPPALSHVSSENGPLVLIVHTHGEECYTEYNDMYPEGDASRSGDTEKNVVRVGKEIADTLMDFGIQTLHCTTMHDSESFINAYSGSAKTVKKYLEEYPSVKIVVDVHRDAIIRDNGESVKAVTQIAGQDYAQLMFVVGTNELGHNHPDWQDNLSLALTLQKSMDDTYPSLCRSINLRNVPFNQQLSSGYLLLEVGTCANTLDEALRSARAFGENLARTIITA